MKFVYKIYKLLPVRVRWWISYLLAAKFLVGFVAIIISDNKLLLVKQSYQYHFGLPGGFLKTAENLKDGYA
jgi:ADP-ribose pyrophosphatase YjhB (NUDIX family)